LKTSLNDLKLAGVNHHWYISDLGVRLKKSHELGHCNLAVNEAIIKVDVEDLCSVLNLILGHLDGCLIVTLLNELFELDTSRDVAALTHVNKTNDVTKDELGQTR
jgi:hypothetical protein